MINRHALFNEKAEWLWADLARHPDADRTPTTIFAPLPKGFRFRVFEFEKTYLRRAPSPGLLSVTVFADPRFRLWVNGVYIGTGPVAAGGDYANVRPMPKQYVNQYDIPVEGRTVSIRAEVWNGCAVMTDYSVGRCAFVLSGTLDGQEIHTDRSWRMRLLPGYHGVTEVDLTEEPGAWEAPTVLSPAAWNPADPHLPPLCEETIRPETVRRELSAGEMTLLASFPRIYSAYLRLAIKNDTGKPADIRIGIAEGTPAEANAERVTVPASSGTVFYRGLRMWSVGAVLVRAPEGVDVAVSLSYVHYPVDRANEGYFRCSNEKLNRIWEIGKFTLEMCRQSLHLDSPLHQETLGCTGDYAIESLMTRTTFGDMRLVRLDLIRTADYLVMSEGVMFHTSYSLIWVLMLRDYLLWTGDRPALRACLPALGILLDRFRSYIGERGVIENPPNYMFVDWAKIDGFQLHHPPMALGQTVLNAFWQLALQAAATLYRLDGSPNLALEVEQEADRHKEACLRAFHDPGKGLFRDGWTKSECDPAPSKWQPANADRRYYSRHANTLAVLAGFVTGETAKTLAERIISEDWLDKDSAIDIQPYFMHYVCEMAVKTGLWEKYALKLMHLWDRQADDSPKGLKEGWGDFHGDCSHAWGGTPVYQLPVRTFGFEMLEPAFRRFRLRPRLSGLAWAEAGIPTPWGLLKVRADAGGLSADAPDAFRKTDQGRGSGVVFELRENCNAHLTRP
jgi:hypothetical protein